MKPHKHAKLIKAWADGAEIEQRNLDDEDTENWHEFDAFWGDETSHDKWEYRIKPEPKPDHGESMTLFACLASSTDKSNKSYIEVGNFHLIWDGETKKLKSAEMLK